MKWTAGKESDAGMPIRSVHEDERWEEPKKLEFNSIQKHILNFTKSRNGLFTFHDYQKHLDETVENPKQREYLTTRKTISCKTLCDHGYMKFVGNGEYKINPLFRLAVEEQTRKAPFAIKENHCKLLRKHSDGVITKSELKLEYSAKSATERQRQEKFIDGMIRNLTRNGYLEMQGNGRYQLTLLAYQALAAQAYKSYRADKQTENLSSSGEAHSPELETPYLNKEPEKAKARDIKVTAFDRIFLEVTDHDGHLDTERINRHPRKDTVLKRVETLKAGGYIKDNQLTEDLMQRIGIATELNRTRKLSLEGLTTEQYIVVAELRKYMNIFKGQFVKYLYKGNREKAESDLKLLTDYGLIKKDPLWNIYILTEAGVKLTNAIYPDLKYKPKVLSRREEVGHDAMVYSTFKYTEKMIQSKNGTVVGVKTDRDLRREDALKNGKMEGAYPDLRIIYNLPGSDIELEKDLEVDIAYSERVIREKLEKILFGTSSSGGVSDIYDSHGDNSWNPGDASTRSGSRSQNSRKTQRSLGWFCTRASQVQKCIRVFNQVFSEKGSRGISKAKYLELFFIDKNGDVHKIPWR